MPLIPDYNRKSFDVLLLGATGHIGRFASRYMYRQSCGLRWAVGGRNYSKLSSLITELITMDDVVNNKPDILIIDAIDYRGLVETFAEVRIVINCITPHQSYGRDIISACIDAGSNYLDACGDPQFIESMFLEFHDKALQKGLLAINACGFDSAPADLGYLFTLKQYSLNRCSFMESFTDVTGPNNISASQYVTFEGAINSKGDVGTLKRLKKESHNKYKPPSLEHTPGPTLSQNSSYFYEDRLNRYAAPYNGSHAAAIVSSQRSISMRTGQVMWPQHLPHIALPSYFDAAASSAYSSVFTSIASYKVGRRFLQSAFPQFTLPPSKASKLQPTKELVEETSFDIYFFAGGYAKAGESHQFEGLNLMSLEARERRKVYKKLAKTDTIKQHRPFAGTTGTSDSGNSCTVLFGMGKRDSTANSSPGGVGKGYHTNNLTAITGEFEVDELDKYITTMVSGPEPTYMTTPAILISLATLVLEERQTLPLGGILTPMSAFFDCPSVFSRLSKVGITFSLLNDTSETIPEEAEVISILNNKNNIMEDREVREQAKEREIRAMHSDIGDSKSTPEEELT